MHVSCCITDMRAGSCQLSAGARETRRQRCPMQGGHHGGRGAPRGLGQPWEGLHHEAASGWVLPPEKRRSHGRSRHPQLCRVVRAAGA